MWVYRLSLQWNIIHCSFSVPSRLSCRFVFPGRHACRTRKDGKDGVLPFRGLLYSFGIKRCIQFCSGGMTAPAVQRWSLVMMVCCGRVDAVLPNGNPEDKIRIMVQLLWFFTSQTSMILLAIRDRMRDRSCEPCGVFSSWRQRRNDGRSHQLHRHRVSRPCGCTCVSEESLGE